MTRHSCVLYTLLVCVNETESQIMLLAFSNTTVDSARGAARHCVNQGRKV